MASPSEKLAGSLSVLHQLQKDGMSVIQSNDLTRTHKERLIKNGFLKEVIKGWYIPSRPDETDGESTAWYASFWDFCATYLDRRFNDDWCLSPEQSLLLHANDWTVPRQLLIRSSKGNNNIIQLPHNTSLLDTRSTIPDPNSIEKKNKIKILTLPWALTLCSPQFFTQYPAQIRSILSSITDISDLLSILLDKNHTTIAGRLAGAFRNIGETRIANNIIKTMEAAGHKIKEADPFKNKISMTLSARTKSSSVKRMQITWMEMRETVIKLFPKPKEKLNNIRSYMKNVEEIYSTDAYHSLSIEGYQVNETLIEKVRSGNWSPDLDENDQNHKNALAARGYWQAFQAVKKSVHQVLKKSNAGNVVDKDHSNWYLELFGPSVTAGILKPAELAGYRNGPVYIRHSRHVPPTCKDVRDMMPTFFQLLQNEKEASVRIVLGHFFFVYIHPYFDGNGRMGRFLMNVMCASGSYPWTVVPVEHRKQYMNALEEASTKQNIKPFCKFIAKLITN